MIIRATNHFQEKVKIAVNESLGCYGYVSIDCGDNIRWSLVGVGLGTNPRLATLYYQPSSDEDCVNLTFSIGLDGKTYSVFLQGQEKMPKLLNLFKELGAEETETELHTNIFNWKIHMPFGSISEVFDKICLVLSG